VIRIHVPPLRDRREEIPHLSTYFLREASERLGKPDIQLSSEALDMFSQYWWPGNVRQLKNEIQRAVAMSAPGGTIEAAHLSPEIGSTSLSATTPTSRSAGAPANLATAIEQVERDLFRPHSIDPPADLGRRPASSASLRRGLYQARRLGLTRRPNSTPSSVFKGSLQPCITVRLSDRDQ
jgi:transcriptional regulator with AAA-type ATPase domain